VLSAYEARQWELPVMFVCGLVEGQFPRYRPPDPLLPEPLRRHLRERGFRIRTGDDFEKEEKFLFDSALSRAKKLVVMSYPRNDIRGERNLPSLFLNSAEAPTESCPVRPQRRHPETAGAAVVIGSRDLLEVIGDKHAQMRPTALESYLQCPFQFFARHTLGLDGPPPRPDKRLDFLMCGSIVHRAINQWLESHGDIDEIFERVFGEVVEAQHVPATYRTELLRARMLVDLRRFTESDPCPAAYASSGEISCQFPLESGLIIRCRLDRLIRTPEGRAFVIDYKYSAKDVREYLSDSNLLQAPLYWLAAENAFPLDTAGVYYCTLRNEVQYGGWGEKPGWLPAIAVEPFTPDWLAAAVARSTSSLREIACGRIEPSPSDVSKCGFCDFKDVCRYPGVETAVAEGAS
jgi:ATP-dependent helicase/DNAse subunit B